MRSVLMPSCEGHGSSSTAKPMTMPVESEISVMYALITWRTDGAGAGAGAGARAGSSGWGGWGSGSGWGPRAGEGW